MFFRMYENFSGCRVLAYCVMSNHFHLLLEVPRMADGGLSDAELLKRLGGLYSEVVVAGVAAELAEARKLSIGEIDGAADARVAAIHARYTYRQQGVCERGVCTGERASQRQAQGRSAGDEGQRQRREGTAVECQGFAREGLKSTQTRRLSARPERIT